MSEENTVSADQMTLLKNAEALLADPETRSDFFGLVKKKNPTLVIPEVDVPARFMSVIEEERKQREALQTQMQEDRARAEVEKRRSKLHGKGLTDSDITEVEKMMTEKGIVSHDTAADYYLQSRKLAEGSTNEGGSNKQPTFNPMEEAKKDFGGDIRAWGRAQALKDMRDFKRKVAT